MTAQSKQSTALTSPGYLVPFITVTALFFIFGFITNLNMALVPHLKAVFTLPYAWAMLAESAFFLAYLVFSWPTSKLIELIGYKKTMVVSLFIQVVGCLLFVPAAKMVSFPLFLTAVFVVGAGVTALQTSANPYVSILGPEGTSSIRLNLAQAFNSIGGTIAPLIAGAYILTDLGPDASQSAVAETVRLPYILIAAALLLLGLALAFMHLPHIETTQEFRPGREGDPILSRSIWSYGHTVQGAIGIFFYVGVEVGLASIAVDYFKTQGMSTAETASFLLSLYWLGALIGRLLGAGIMTRKAAGHLRFHRGCSHCHLDVHKWMDCHRHPGAMRVLQLGHVPQHLYAGHCGAWADDQQGFRIDHDRGCGRGSDSTTDRQARRPCWNSVLLRHPGHLLPLHRLLRAVGIQTYADCDGVGWMVVP